MKLFSLVFFSFVLAGFSFLNAQNAKLTGKWSGKDETGKLGVIAFDKKGYVSFLMDGEAIGGKKYNVDGVEMSLSYETNEEVVPHTIDFIMKLKESDMELMRMLGIYKLLNDKFMILHLKYDGSERPEKFDSESIDQISLTKIK